MGIGRIGKMLSYAVVGLWIVGATFPQTGLAQGESAVPFLLIAPNARADGMGEAGAALADDASAVHWNPGGLAFQRGQEISLTHSNWLPAFHQADLFYDFFSYRNYIESWGGTVSASITYLNLGEFVITDETGPDEKGRFKGYEVAVTAGYATQLSDELGFGLNLRYIRSALAPIDVQGQGREGIGSTVSFDMAALWKPTSLGPLGDRVNVGLNLSNLGPKITYIDAEQADPLPTNLRLGLGFNIVRSEYNNINWLIDFSRILVRRYASDSTTLAANGKERQPDNLPKSLFTAWGDGGLKKVTIGTGLEYWYGSPRLIALRAGYFYEDPHYGNRKFLTFGAGIRYDLYGFDFSYLSAIEENHPLGETLRFTLSIAWGRD
jgi:hypothetical protein